MLLKSVIVLVLLGLAFGVYYVRSASLDVAGLHIDPESAPRPNVPGHVLVRAGGDIEPPVFDRPASELAKALEAVILSTPRTVKLTGDLGDGLASYVTRSRLWGFPDIASVKVADLGGGTSSLVILSRLTFGYADMGVNRARIEGWLSQL